MSDAAHAPAPHRPPANEPSLARCCDGLVQVMEACCGPSSLVLPYAIRPNSCDCFRTRALQVLHTTFWHYRHRGGLGRGWGGRLGSRLGSLPGAPSAEEQLTLCNPCSAPTSWAILHRHGPQPHVPTTNNSVVFLILGHQPCSVSPIIGTQQDMGSCCVNCNECNPPPPQVSKLPPPPPRCPSYGFHHSPAAGWFANEVMFQRGPKPPTTACQPLVVNSTWKEAKWGEYKKRLLQELGELANWGWTVAHTDGLAKQVCGWTQAGHGVWHGERWEKDYHNHVSAHERQSISRGELRGILQALMQRQPSDNFRGSRGLRVCL